MCCVNREDSFKFVLHLEVLPEIRYETTQQKESLDSVSPDTRLTQGLELNKTFKPEITQKY